MARSRPPVRSGAVTATGTRLLCTRLLCTRLLCTGLLSLALLFGTHLLVEIPAFADTLATAAIDTTPDRVDLQRGGTTADDTVSVSVTYSCTNDDTNIYYLTGELTQDAAPSYVFGDPATLPGRVAAQCDGTSITQSLVFGRQDRTDARLSYDGSATLTIGLTPQSTVVGEPAGAQPALSVATTHLVVPPVLTAPSAPDSVVVAATTSTVVTLTWDEPASSGGSPITGYRLSRSGFETILDATQRSYAFAGLTPGSSYNLYVQALNAVGRGAAVRMSVTTPATPPSTPRSVTAVRTSTSVIVSWTPPINTGGAPVTGYRLSRSGFETQVPPTTGSYTFTGLKASTAYNLYVQARYSAGLGAAAKLTATTLAPSITPPSAPRSVKASPKSTSAILGWSAPSNLGGSPITSYRLSRAGFEHTVSASARSYTFTGLRSGTSYALYVQAKNKAGQGNAVRVTVTTTKPPTPPKAYPDCAAMHVDYPHGVGKSGAVDHTSSTPVTDFYVSNTIYAMNDGRDKALGQYDLDRDNDGIACEQ